MLNSYNTHSSLFLSSLFLSIFISFVLVIADGDADEQEELPWVGVRKRKRLGRHGLDGGVCTNYTDNYCAALIKRRQQIRLLLVPNFAAS